MPYTQQQWHDDTTTAPYGPINGTRLNYIEAGIGTATDIAEAALAAGGGGGTVSFGTATPLVDGTGAAGTRAFASHEDHVHPTDTSRAPLASPTFTGSPVLPTGTTGTTQSASDNSTKLATTAYTDTADALKANLASPTFTGTPSLPTGTTGTTQSAADSTTKLATTAFVTTADNLKANLASPTFTGSPVLPTGTTATTQSASDNSTKLATTAYVDTADNLKANLASPTFTGTVVLPTGTVTSGMILDGTIADADVSASAAVAVSKLAAGTATYVLTSTAGTAVWAAAAGGAPSGAAGGSLTGTYPNPTIASIPSGATATTQTAADNSTKVATTAYVDTADALKANLASPTFTGTPTLPTGTIATTQSAANNTTAVATTAYADRVPSIIGSYALGSGTYASVNPMAAAISGATLNAGDGRWVRVVMGQSGTLHDVSFLTATTGNNYNILVLDDGQANATHTVRTCLYIKGATAVPAGGSWMTGDANLAVTAGQTMVFMQTFSATTAQVTCIVGVAGAATLPTSFFPGSGAATTSQKIGGSCLSANVPAAVNGTVTDANLPVAAGVPLCVWRIT